MNILLEGLFLVRCFKARKQTVKIYCRQHRYDQMMEAYGELLKLAYSKYEYRMRSLVDFVSSSVSQKSDLLQQFYEATVEALGKSKYRAVWKLFFCFVYAYHFSSMVQRRRISASFSEPLVPDESETLQHLV